MEFIYFGEATLYEERMNKFLSVAKSLEIKDLCKAHAENGTVKNNEAISSNYTEESKSESDINHPNASEDHNYEFSSSDNQKISQRKRRKALVCVDKKFKCDQCDKEYGHSFNLYEHIRSAHKGLRFACDQCDYQATRKNNLKLHIESKHEGVNYVCDQCDYQNSRQDSLKKHIESKHEGVRYACDQCNYQATTPGNLKIHIKSRHEGVM